MVPSQYRHEKLRQFPLLFCKQARNALGKAFKIKQDEEDAIKRKEEEFKARMEEQVWSLSEFWLLYNLGSA